MAPATWPRERPLDERMLCIDPPAGTFEDARLGDLPRFLRRGDLLVVNDAATVPAALHGRTTAGQDIEVRFAAHKEATVWTCVSFGAGNWRMRTEDRPPPPRLALGDHLRFGPALRASVVGIAGPRLPILRFWLAKGPDAEGGLETEVSPLDPAAVWRAIYDLGKPVQYAYIERDLALWHVQTPYASRPWAVEMPSAGRPLCWGLLFDAVRAGVELARVTHAAGLSSTGELALDAQLPLPERFDVPKETVAAIERTRARGGRVVAVGTSVVRALEGSAASHGGALVAGEGVTPLRLGPGSSLRVVDGLFTGMHEPTASHYELMQAFAPLDLLRSAYAHAEALGYLGHEFGDSTLILA
jgi:S-adenosylmethionine:tRNA ribosyltransferase-isomerase